MKKAIIAVVVALASAVGAWALSSCCPDGACCPGSCCDELKQ